MAVKEKAFMNWSGGKDSALCLFKALDQGIAVRKLVTTINRDQERISMHGVRCSLLEKQAASLGLPLKKIELPGQASMQIYEDTMRAVHRSLKAEGFTHGLYGDIFLQDLKDYREVLLGRDGLTGIFPLWKSDTRELMMEFISRGFKAIVVCINTSALDQSFCGRMLDERFVNDLPPAVDICGENGEYHSFVFDGPGFKEPVRFKKGAVVYREYASPKVKADECFNPDPPPPAGFYFCDLLDSAD
jgi:uncharacterized protein (TIGR00290 family)